MVGRQGEPALRSTTIAKTGHLGKSGWYFNLDVPDQAFFEKSTISEEKPVENLDPKSHNFFEMQDKEHFAQ
jgi:hypothetical protein